jgi:dihydroflavonol-4-reductase
MESNYVRTKRMAQLELERRVTEEGLHAVALVPAAIYGPSPVTQRALDPSGLDAAILRAIRGQLPRYPAIYAGWVLAEQVARRALLALDRGQPGVRYFAMGDAKDRQAHPEFFSMACELAGVDARVAATPNPDEDPSVVEEFGTYAYMAQIVRPDPLFDDSLTLRTLGDPPVSLAEGLPRTIAWLKEIGEI